MAEEIMKTEDITLEYYEKNADAFFEGTVSVDMTYARERFLAKLPGKAYLLDLGCGSGRDAKAFLELGYAVDAVDGSEELCRRASSFTGIEVKCMLFQDLDETEKYDGIWACASLLHLPRKELTGVFRKIKKALKQDGILYTGFKYGTFEGMRNGRYFTDFTEETFRAFLDEFPGFTELEHWVTADVRPGRGEEKWFNVLLEKMS
jgi:SAM-dependent methyltransferase